MLMTMDETPHARKSRQINRTLSIAEHHSRKIDALAARLGVTYSAVLNMVLAGEIQLHKKEN